MNYVNEQNMQEILDGIARKIGTGGTGNGLEDWQAEHEYIEKDICVYEGQIYRAKVGFTSDTTFNTTQILEEYEPVGGETIIPYEQDTEISIDDIVSYDNNTYKALYNFVCGEEFSLYALEEYVPIELTDDDIKEIVNSYNPVFEEAKGVEYSTEERRIGTWIDGKPLYQITIVDTMPTVITDGQRVVKHINIDNLKVKYAVKLDGFFSYSSGMSFINSIINIVDTVPYLFEAQCIKSNNTNTNVDVLQVGSTASWSSNQPVYIILQYTKTTD